MSLFSSGSIRVGHASRGHACRRIARGRTDAQPLHHTTQEMRSTVQPTTQEKSTVQQMEPWLVHKLPVKGTSKPSQKSVVNQLVPANNIYQYMDNNERQMFHRTLSRIRELVKLAGWWVHNDAIARLLQEAKDLVYSAEDFLDCLNDLVYSDEGFLDHLNYFAEEFFNFSNRPMEIQQKINHLIEQTKHLRLHDKRQRFIDESLDTKVDLFADEQTIVGRERDLRKLIQLLGLQGSSSVHDHEQVSCTTTVPDLNRGRPENVSVLPIAGSGGVGKTTLAQHIFKNEKRVQDHFDQLIWMCVSDGFDHERCLTDGFIHPSKKFFLVLDDVQEDVCKEEYNGWKSFLAPFKSARSGSTILVTTRSLKIAEHLGTMKHIVLDGLPEESLWELFRMHVFGSDNSNCSQELEGIGRSIVRRLNGSSIDAKILGKLLSLKFDAIYWKKILESELWYLPRQEMIGSNPALLMSYQYMPSHLRQCFSFCSLYPKGYNFEAEILVNCWVAVALVAPDGDMLAADIGHLYFQQLVGRSFLHRVTSSKYAMHGLLYDMAQQILSNKCFVLKGRDDISRIPHKVRHVSILGHSGLSSNDLERLSLYGTLRFHGVPKGITMLVNLRKVRLKGDLMNQLGCVPWIGQLVFLQEMPYYAVDDTPGRRFEELKNMNHLRGALEISGLHNVTCKEQAAEGDLDKKIYLNTLTILWHDSISPDKHNSSQEMEVLEGLLPSPSINHLEVRFYMGSGFHPSWLLHGEEHEPTSSKLESLSINSCPNISSLFIIEIGGSSSRGRSTVFRSLTKLCITWCRKLRSLDNLLRPELLPEIKVIRISNCEELASLPTDQLSEFTRLEDLEMSHCWSLSWERGLTLPRSLKSLKLGTCGEITDSAISCGLCELPSLATLDLQFCSGVESIGAEVWSGMSSLWSLKIFCCQELSSIGGAGSIAKVEKVDIRHCPKLRELERPFQRG
uniref:NB-ARC domain-containing protein n=1 Tax=Leersia perrieri TaxID=77586 RepID=A0A0D9XD05_9ORYZ